MFIPTAALGDMAPTAGTASSTQAFCTFCRDTFIGHGCLLGTHESPCPTRGFTGCAALTPVQVFAVAGFDLLKPWPLQIVLDNVLGHKLLSKALLQGWPSLALLAGACVASCLSS